MTSHKSARANRPHPHPILDPSARVVERAGRVKISQEAIRQLAGELSSNNESHHWLPSAPAAFVSGLEKLSLHRQILFLTVFHSAGFSYWGDPPWSVSDGGTTYNGSMAWFIALSRDERCLDAQFLAGLTSGQWQNITRGRDATAMPMLAERLSILQKLGAKLKNSESALISRFTAGGAALDLAFFISEELPGFDDRAVYDDLTVPFLKRAQLLAGDLNHVLVKHGRAPLAKMDNLTAFADYKIPQFLRHKKVLVYDSSLAQTVDNQIELAPGSKEEVEIRACTIAAVEALRQELALSQITVNACTLDHRLWLAAQKPTHPACSPYHRCRTIYY